MNRIQRVSSFFLIIFKVLLLMLPSLAIFKWVFIRTDFMGSEIAHAIFYESIRLPDGSGNINLLDVAWTPLTQLMGLTQNIISLLPIFIGLYALIRIFNHYKQGEIFNMMNARYFRLIGWMFILDALITKPISECLMSLAVTLNNEPGHRYLTLSFGSPNLDALFCGAVVIIVSWVMLEASKLHDDQQYTV